MQPRGLRGGGVDFPQRKHDDINHILNTCPDYWPSPQDQAKQIIPGFTVKIYVPSKPFPVIIGPPVISPPPHYTYKYSTVYPRPFDVY